VADVCRDRRLDFLADRFPAVVVVPDEIHVITPAASAIHRVPAKYSRTCVLSQAPGRHASWWRQDPRGLGMSIAQAGDERAIPLAVGRGNGRPTPDGVPRRPARHRPRRRAAPRWRRGVCPFGVGVWRRIRRQARVQALCDVRPGLGHQAPQMARLAA
jgi:hypothetical protein